MAVIDIVEDDEWFVITDTETGVTTQGKTKLEALLMLTDALAAHQGSDEDLVETALDVFVPDQELDELRCDALGCESTGDDVSDPQRERQQQAAVLLAKRHKNTDFSEEAAFTELQDLLRE